MIWRWLEAIRRKPKHVREQYAFGIAVTFTGLVIAVWSFSLPSRFVNTVNGEGAVASAPFSGLFNEFKEGLGSIKSDTAEIFGSEMSEIAPLFASSSESAGLPNAQELWQNLPTSTTPAPALIRIATSTTVVATTSVTP